MYAYLRPRVLWTVDLPESPVGGLAAGGGLAYVALADNTLRAWDLADGKPRWSRDLGGPAQSGPAFGGGQVVVADTARRLRAFAAETGKPAWEATLKALASTEPATGSEVVAIGEGDHVCAAFALADGTMLWRRVALGDVVATPWVGQSIVVFGSTGHALAAVAKTTGEALKEIVLSGEVLGRPGSDAVGAASPFIAVGTHDGRLHALSGGWTRPWSAGLRGVTRAAPLVTAESVFAGTDQGLVYALDRADGSTRWRTGVGGPVVERLALVAGRIVAASGGILQFLDARTGEVQEAFPLDGVARGMGEEQGVVVVTTSTRRLVAVGVRISAGEQGPQTKSVLASVIADPSELSPARGETAGLSFSLLEDRALTVDVADPLGKRVRLLANRERAFANSYRFDWDGRDEQGKLVKPGVYRLRVVAGDEEVSVGIELLGTR